MNPIRTNKSTFFGDDGEVLKSGQIYIGQPNQWPLSFPKTVTFQDSAGSQFTAAQPLTTNNQGRIEYNGKSVVALVDGDYSILVRDRNGVTVGEGYTPFVANAASGTDLSGVTQVGLLLSDIKQFDVTPGETVRNVGKTTTLDGLGADWLVVNATGNPADDTDLIDFANGTQGQRVGNVLYDKDAGTAALRDIGTTVDGNVPEIQYEEVTVTGDFSSFTLYCMKIGKLVTIQSNGVVTHASNSTPSAAGVVPVGFRPVDFQVEGLYNRDGASLRTIEVNTAGTLSLTYSDYTGAVQAYTNSGGTLRLTYLV